MHDVLGTRRAALRNCAAPDHLRARCASFGGTSEGLSVPAWRSRTVPLALAATLVIIVAGAAVHRLTQTSVRVMAAELVADHVKCFMMNAVLGTHHEHDAAEQSLASAFAWDVDLPDRPETAGLELVGARTCLYGEGRVAHVMYRYQGRPVSVFMLPEKERPDEQIDMMGYQEAIWSSRGRTFVLVADQPQVDVQRLASFFHDTLR
jgi:anti-sigma factor RsiW